MRVVMSASVSRLTSRTIMWAPTSTQALSARRRQFPRPGRSRSPRVWLAKSTTVVVPPKAAALVPVPKVSTVRAAPKSQSRWVCTSTPPGRTSRPRASYTCAWSAAGRPCPIMRTRSPSMRMSAVYSSTAVTIRPFLISVDAIWASSRDALAHGSQPVEGGERAFDDLARELPDDEDQTRAAVRRGPAVQVHGRMHQMLDAMDDHRRGHADHVEDSLHSQDIVAVGVEEHREPDAERRPVQRTVDGHAEGVDVAVVGADLTGGRLRRRRARRHPEPAPGVLPRAGRIGGVADEELLRPDRTDRRFEDRRGRVD